LLTARHELELTYGVQYLTTRLCSTHVALSSRVLTKESAARSKSSGALHEFRRSFGRPLGWRLADFTTRHASIYILQATCKCLRRCGSSLYDRRYSVYCLGREQTKVKAGAGVQGIPTHGEVVDRICTTIWPPASDMSDSNTAPCTLMPVKPIWDNVWQRFCVHNPAIAH